MKKLDLTVQKNWKIPYLGDQGPLQFRAEAYDATNTPVFGAPNNISYSSNNSVTPDARRVGEIRSLLNPMRIISFGLKLYFRSPHLLECCGGDTWHSPKARRRLKSS